MLPRIRHLLLCGFLIGPMAAPGSATMRMENRVGESPVFSSTVASESLSQAFDPHQENPTCHYDFASGVRKYLYAHGNPVMMPDPSGHESMVSVNFTTAMMFMFALHEVRGAHAALTGARALFGADENVNNIIYGLDVIKTVDEAIGVATLGAGAIYGGFKILNILKGALTGPTATKIANRKTKGQVISCKRFRYVQQMLGHVGLNTTEICTHVNIQKLIEVHRLTHPAKLPESTQGTACQPAGNDDIKRP